MSNSDIYKFRDLVAKASAPKQQPIVEELEDDLSPDEASQLADEIEQYVNDLSGAMESIEHIVKSRLPREYRYMEHYTFPHIKTCIGGYGYEDRMIKTFNDLIEDLRNHEGFDDDEE